jgi:hypothetical protein
MQRGVHDCRRGRRTLWNTATHERGGGAMTALAVAGPYGSRPAMDVREGTTTHG